MPSLDAYGQVRSQVFRVENYSPPIRFFNFPNKSEPMNLSTFNAYIDSKFNKVKMSSRKNLFDLWSEKISFTEDDFVLHEIHLDTLDRAFTIHTSNFITSTNDFLFREIHKAHIEPGPNSPRNHEIDWDVRVMYPIAGVKASQEFRRTINNHVNHDRTIYAFVTSGIDSAWVPLTKAKIPVRVLEHGPGKLIAQKYYDTLITPVENRIENFVSVKNDVSQEFIENLNPVEMILETLRKVLQSDKILNGNANDLFNWCSLRRSIVMSQFVRKHHILKSSIFIKALNSECPNIAFGPRISPKKYMTLYQYIESLKTNLSPSEKENYSIYVMSGDMLIPIDTTDSSTWSISCIHSSFLIAHNNVIKNIITMKSFMIIKNNFTLRGKAMTSDLILRLADRYSIAFNHLIRAVFRSFDTINANVKEINELFNFEGTAFEDILVHATLNEVRDKY